MTGGYEVQYMRQELDVAWYGRACVKLIRDKVSRSRNKGKRYYLPDCQYQPETETLKYHDFEGYF